MDKKEQRRLEFCEMYKQRLIECLADDDLCEELAFSLIGIELCLRQREIVSITKEQIDLQEDMVRNIRITKVDVNNYANTEIYYDDKPISNQLHCVLENLLERSENKKLFASQPFQYIENISKSIGDSNFNGHMLRQIGIILKANETINFGKQL